MKTIFEIPTIGDSMTVPGGITLRYNADRQEFVVHNFNTDRETGEAREYWQGSYYTTTGGKRAAFMKALTEFTRRADRAATYDQGGSIDFGKLFGFPSVPGLVDASGAFDMAEALRD